MSTSPGQTKTSLSVATSATPVTTVPVMVNRTVRPVPAMRPMTSISLCPQRLQLEVPNPATEACTEPLIHLVAAWCVATSEHRRGDAASREDRQCLDHDR